MVAGNLNRKAKDIRLFETGRVYLPTGEEGALPDERKYVCIALCGDHDFFSIKGVVENLLDAFGIRSTRFMPDASEYYHPGCKASVYACGEKLGELGELGEVHPDVCAAFDIGKRVYIAELDIKKLSAASCDVVKYKPLPRFPEVERDIALIVDADVPAGALLDCIRENAGPYFESAALFDVYTG